MDKIIENSITNEFTNSFGQYAMSVIVDRALPDLRDGLKPVHRRILYSMYEASYTPDKPHRKSARIVGDVMGKYHPHGDTSIYDAMVRMAQTFSFRYMLVDGHGNFGTMDGDGAAAMRYTEARLSKMAEVMLNAINKNTVEMTYNFDDEELEPTVLPAHFPNLLVNGSTGISAGYATNIPPHNLSEVIDATIKRIESPNCKLETIMELMPGPDFPTGGVIEGKNGLIDAYTKGKGKVILKSDCEIVSNNNKKQIIVHSIPYEVIKEQLIKKITEIKLDKKIEGINDVIDESDNEHMARIVIDLKKDANATLVLNYLLKNTDLQINYNFNMVAIVNRRPRLVGVLEILDAFINHQREVITRRTKFDLEHAKAQYHILEGLIKAISILDEVIKIIRGSKNKSDAIDNLCKEYDFTFEQAKAIVELQLYRLTNTDIVALKEEMEELAKNIHIWEQILNNDEALKHVMKTELKIIKKEYGNARRTKIKDEVTEIKLDMTDIIPKENVVVVITNEGYIKKVSMKSYASRGDEETTLKPGDFVTNIYELTTLDTILVFTNQGNYLYIPVHKIPEAKWKELGKHVNNIVMMASDEVVVSSIVLADENKDIITITKNGLVKKSILKDYIVTRYSKPMSAIKLKDDDEVVDVKLSNKNIILVSSDGFYTKFLSDEIPLTGVKSGGVKGMNLKDSFVVSALIYDNAEYIDIFTNNKTAKRIKELDFLETGRAKRGNNLIKKVKSVNYEVIKALTTDARDIILLKSDSEIREIKNSEIAIMDLVSTGSNISKYKIDAISKKSELQSYLKKNKEEMSKDEVVLDKVKELSMADFLDDFKI